MQRNLVFVYCYYIFIHYCNMIYAYLLDHLELVWIISSFYTSYALYVISWHILCIQKYNSIKWINIDKDNGSVEKMHNIYIYIYLCICIYIYIYYELLWLCRTLRSCQTSKIIFLDDFRFIVYWNWNVIIFLWFYVTALVAIMKYMSPSKGFWKLELSH